MNEVRNAVTADSDKDKELARQHLYEITAGVVNPVARPAALAARIAEIVEAGISPLRITVDSGVSRDDLDAWMAGQRDPSVSSKLAAWIKEIDAELEKAKAHLVRTPLAESILRGFEKARESRGPDRRRGITLIYGVSGVGKTECAKLLEATDPNVVRFQVNGESKTYVSVLKGILHARQGYGYAATGEAVTDAVLRMIKPGGLIIIDNAHLLQLRVIEQLTVFPDEHEIGLALIGNVALYKSIFDAKTKQIISRVGGGLVHVGIPTEDDVDLILEAEGIIGRREGEFCRIIGCQDGGLRYLYETIREARKIFIASGEKRMDLRFLKVGAENAGHWGRNV